MSKSIEFSKSRIHTYVYILNFIFIYTLSKKIHDPLLGPDTVVWCPVVLLTKSEMRQKPFCSPLLWKNSPCVVVGEHHGDSVRHHPLPVVVTDPGILPRNAKQQVCKTHIKECFRKETTPHCVMTLLYSI